MNNLYIYIIGGVLLAVLLKYLSQRNSKKITECNTKNNEDEFLEEDLYDDFMNEVDFSRQFHYDFAHNIIKNEFFKDPNTFINLILTQKNTIHNIWNNAQDYYMEQYDEVSVPIESKNLSLYTCKSDDIIFIIIEMPTPKQMTEVYFIGMFIDKKENNNVQYITLEYGEDESKAVLCGWTEDGIHLNYGDSPKLTLDEFKALLLERNNKQLNKTIEKWQQVA